MSSLSRFDSVSNLAALFPANGAYRRGMARREDEGEVVAQICASAPLSGDRSAANAESL